MSREVMEELKRGEELLNGEVNQLNNQMNLVMQVLFRREGNPSPCQQLAYPIPQIQQPWMMPPQQNQHHYPRHQ